MRIDEVDNATVAIVMLGVALVLMVFRLPSTDVGEVMKLAITSMGSMAMGYAVAKLESK